METSEEERNAIAAEIRAVEESIAADRLPANGSRDLLPNVEGFFSDAEGVALARLCRDASLLEIGSWKGRSTVFAATGGASRIVCIDTWEGDAYTGPGNFWPEFRANVDAYTAHGRVVPMVGRFQDVLQHVALWSFDVLHYDADHDDEPTAGALVAFANRCRPDAVVVCHDANYPNVRKIVEEVSAEWEREVVIVDRLAILFPHRCLSSLRLDSVRASFGKATS